MDPKQQKAFEFAADLSKQLVNYTAIYLIAPLTITFWKDLLPAGSVHMKWLAYWSWYSLLVSAVCGIWMLMALTGTLEPLDDPAATAPTIRGRNVTVPSTLQIVSFLAGVALMVGFVRMNY